MQLFHVWPILFRVVDEKEVKFQPDFVLGCDGAFSTVRKEYMRHPWFNYSQTYIPHAYKEFCINPIEGVI